MVTADIGQVVPVSCIRDRVKMVVTFVTNSDCITPIGRLVLPGLSEGCPAPPGVRTRPYPPTCQFLGDQRWVECDGRELRTGSYRATILISISPSWIAGSPPRLLRHSLTRQIPIGSSRSSPSRCARVGGEPTPTRSARGKHGKSDRSPTVRTVTHMFSPQWLKSWRKNMKLHSTERVFSRLSLATGKGDRT